MSREFIRNPRLGRPRERLIGASERRQQAKEYGRLYAEFTRFVNSLPADLIEAKHTSFAWYREHREEILRGNAD
ncbi:hypothetical protein M0R72_16750 [Candidatus Pacearchaeota archaeon]|jgi:hypothetical protein|nr:hypothetical protein [Candidatus Pacearchaeota archaeon]